jgi:hypothetical protein
MPKDKFINEMMKALLWSNGSLAKLVQYSAPHQETFRRHQVRHLARAANVLKNLSYAEHRFDSSARPLGRMVVHVEALVLTANDIIRERAPNSKDYKGAPIGLWSCLTLNRCFNSAWLPMLARSSCASCVSLTRNALIYPSCLTTSTFSKPRPPTCLFALGA